MRDIYVIDCAALWPEASDINTVAEGLVSILEGGDMKLLAGSIELGTIERVDTAHGQVRIYTRLLDKVERVVYQGGI